MKPAIITDVQVDDERITFALSDGRVVSAPTSWSSRLTSATAEERAAYRVGGSGSHVEWPRIDEHIGLWTMLGVPEDVFLEAAGFTVKRQSVTA